jgi:hypothetical protein
MREAVGSGNHKTAAAMVNAADALWDALESNDPTITAAMAQHNMSPTPAKGKKGNKSGSNAKSKSYPSSPSAFHKFRNPSNGMCKYNNFYGSRTECVWTVTPIQKTNTSPSPFWLDGCNTKTCHCHHHPFPSQL